MKVLILADSSSSHTLKWVHSLSEQGLEVFLFSMYSNVEPGIQRLVDDERIQLSLGEEGYTGSILDSKFLRRCLALRKLISSYKPDILHAHYASSYGLLGATTFFRPYLISVWGSDIFSFPRKSWVFKQILKFNLASSNMVYSSSEVMAKETGKYCSKSIEVIPFGVDSEFLIPVNRLGRSILTIGTIKRLEHIYGIDTLIHAFAICVNSNPEVNMRLAITGDGRLKNDLIILAKGHGIEHLCEFTGSVAHAEIKRHLDELDIFVALSREESFGVAIIEAQSCGLPVVVSNAPGPKEIVKQEVSGFIVDKEDPEAAAQAISMLIRNESLRIEMGNSGRDIVLEKYDWKMNVCQMIEAYQSQIKE